jgi:hypothetical protein
MVLARAQLEELKKPNPRYLIELHTIRGMIQEADNMDKGFKTVLMAQAPGPGPMMPSSIPSALQPPLHPLPMSIPQPFTQPTTTAAAQLDESPSPPDGGMFDREGLFDEEVRIAMDKLKIDVSIGIL